MGFVIENRMIIKSLVHFPFFRDLEGTEHETEVAQEEIRGETYTRPPEVGTRCRTHGARPGSEISINVSVSREIPPASKARPRDI
jgi:hypothetical protein